MDTSETYIKMCEKAEQIQAMRNKVSDSWAYENNWKEGDFYCEPGLGSGFHSGCESGEYGLLDYSTRIFLPRQDQLQEMVNYFGVLDKLKRFTNFVEDTMDPYFQEDRIEFTSMEQLWLAFVIEECFSKRWNGADWI